MSIELSSQHACLDPAIETTGTGGLPDGHAQFSLPAVDGGNGAYLFLAAGFVVEAFVWGEVAQLAEGLG